MTKSGRELLDKARNEIQEITADDVKSRLDSGEYLALIDVREPDEYRAGYISGA